MTGSRIRGMGGVAVILAVGVTLAACGGSSDATSTSSAPAASDSTPVGSPDAEAPASEPVAISGSLVIGGWGGAINEATDQYYLVPFRDTTGVTSSFEDAPGTQLAALQAQADAGNVTWDAIDSVPGDAAFALEKAGLLAPLPDELKTKLGEILGPDKVTDFGFSHANVGNVIVCNMDVVAKCPKNIQEFYDVEAFPEARMMPGIGSIMAVTSALVAGGADKATTATTPVDMDAAFAQLDKVKPAVRAFWESGDQQLQIMRSGEVDMGIMWSGRAYALKNEGMNLEINWEGGAYEPSYWALVANGPNPAAATALLESIATNVNGQAGWATALRYSVPNPEAIDLLPSDVAPEMADNAANFSQLAVPNFAWYAENEKELNRRYQDWLKG